MFAHHCESKQRHCHFNCIGLWCTIMVFGDDGDEYHKLVHGQWRQSVKLQDMEEVTAGNRDTQMAKKQRLYLKHYYNSPEGATAWQNDMI